MSSKGAKKEVAKKEETKKVETKPKEAKEPKQAGESSGGNIMDDLSKKQAFKKFSFRGEDINKLLSLNMDELA
jgi:hypothetical protein